MPRLGRPRLSAAVLAALCLVGSAHAALAWDAREIAVKVRADEGTAHAVFGFVNAGETPITITGIKPSCSCTIPALAKTTYAPGERGEIGVDLHIGNREGVNRLYVQVDASDSSLTTLTLVADIEPMIAFDLRYVFWQPDEPRAPKRMRVTCAAGYTATIATLRSNDPAFGVTSRPVDDSGRTFEIEVTPPPAVHNFAIITLRVRLANDTAEREFSLVARTLPPKDGPQPHAGQPQS